MPCERKMLYIKRIYNIIECGKRVPRFKAADDIVARGYITVWKIKNKSACRAAVQSAAGTLPGPHESVNLFRPADRLFTLLLIAAACVMFALTGETRDPVAPGALSASTYPKLILACIVAISCALLVRSRAAGNGTDAPSLQALPVIALTAGYILLLEAIGFFLLTPAFLFILPLLAGYRDYARIAAGSVLVTAGLYGVFARVLTVPLPPGLLGE